MVLSKGLKKKITEKQCAVTIRNQDYQSTLMCLIDVNLNKRCYFGDDNKLLRFFQ